MPDDDRHLGCRRRVAVALGADDAVDDGHADAREVTELHAVENVVAGGMLRLVARGREFNRKRLSQPDPERISLTAARRGSTSRRIPWEDVMTREMQRDPESMISRRTLVHGLAIAAGATVVGPGLERAGPLSAMERHSQ